MNKLKYTTTSEVPLQKVSWAIKNTTSWKEQNVDSVISLCNTYSSNRRSPMRIKQRNYNLMNNKIDKADFEYVLNPFNLSKDALNRFQFPASLQPYDVISPLFMLLFGEEAKRLFSPIVRAVNEDTLSQKSEQRKQSILEDLQMYLASQLSPEAQQGQEPPQFPELEKYSRYSEKDMREKVAEDILTYYRKHLRLDDTFQRGWKDALIAGEDLYDVGEIARHPYVRRVNPLEVNFLLNNNSDFIDDADKIYERNRMTVSEIIDEFYEILTAEQIDDLEQHGEGGSTMYNYAGGPTVGDYFGPSSGISTVDSIYSFQDSSNRGGTDVHRVRWKSKKKIGTLHYFDDNDQPQELLVDEFYKPNRLIGEYVEWFWINEYWQGIRIGQDMYLDIKPRKNQFRSIDNLSKCKSGYIGTIYSAINSQCVSLMDRVFPWLCLYFIFWYRMELLIAKNIGKMGLIDTSLIPDGWEVEKWMYYAQAMGFGFVNSYNVGLEGERRGKFNASTQNKTLDLETGNAIQHLTELIEYIKTQIKQTTGITDQRLGDIAASELVGNTQRAVVQSSNITEEYFRVHNFTKTRVCEALIEVAKECLGDNSKVFQYVTDDLATVLFEADGTTLAETDFGVFVTDSVKDQQALETLKQLLQVALQNDKANLSDVVNVLNSESIADIKHVLIDSEQQRMEQAQQAEQQNMELQQQVHQESMDLEQQKLDLQKYKIDEDNRVKIEVATMNSLAIDEGASPEQIVDTGEMALAQQELSSDLYLRQQEMLHDRLTKDQEMKLEKDIKEKELALKKKEMESKESIEKQKLIVVKEQNKNQIQLADKKAKLDKEMMDKKMKIEQMKAKASIQKARQKPKSTKK